jgi:sugar phosphate isomerase/epimerase
MTKLGIQLIVFGKRSGEDLPGVLADVKAAGYDGAEVGNPTGSIAASEYKKLFDAAGLACSGYHTGVDAFADLDSVHATAAHMAGVGTKHLMAGGKWPDRAGYELAAERLNAAGKIASEHGIKVCYHNHHWEFIENLDHSIGMEILLTQTDPSLVNFCFDLYWIACGGEDLVAYLTKNGHRSDYIHLKDGTIDAEVRKPLQFLELGNGQIDLLAATPIVKSLSPAWVTTEQDTPNGKDPKDCAKISADYARGVLQF